MWEKRNTYIVIKGYDILEKFKDNNIQMDESSLIILKINSLEEAHLFCLNQLLIDLKLNSIQISYVRYRIFILRTDYFSESKNTVLKDLKVSYRTILYDTMIYKGLIKMEYKFMMMFLSETNNIVYKKSIQNLGKIKSIKNFSLSSLSEIENVFGKNDIIAEKAVELLFNDKTIKNEYLKLSKINNTKISELVKNALTNFITKK